MEVYCTLHISPMNRERELVKTQTSTTTAARLNTFVNDDEEEREKGKIMRVKPFARVVFNGRLLLASAQCSEFGEREREREKIYATLFFFSSSHLLFHVI